MISIDLTQDKILHIVLPEDVNKTGELECVITHNGCPVDFEKYGINEYTLHIKMPQIGELIVQGDKLNNSIYFLLPDMLSYASGHFPAEIRLNNSNKTLFGITMSVLFITMGRIF